MSAESEAKERSSLEKRLFRQGLLGAGDETGQNPHMRALFEAQKQKDLAREQTSVSMAEDIQNQILNRDITSVSAASVIEGKPLDYLALGANVGIPGARAAESRAGLLANDAYNQQDATSNFWSGIGSTLGGYDFGSLFGSSDPFDGRSIPISEWGG